MKLLHIAHNCVMASNQARLVELTRLGNYEITLLTPPWNLESNGIVRLEKESDPNYTIVRGRPMLSMILGQRYLQFYPFLSRLYRRVRPDVIDVHEEPWSLAACQAIMARNRVCPGVPVVVETEQNVYKDFRFPFSAFERFVLKHANAVIARNAEAEEVMRRKGFRGHVRLLPNGLDNGMFVKKDTFSLRQQLGLKNPVVGYAGRFEREKGLDDLLRAVAALGMPVDILFIGFGRAEMELRQLALELGLRENFVVLPPLEQARLPEYLCCMDVLVLPSRTTPTWKEQFGRALIEAMACEVPVIGSSSGAIPEVIGDAGLVFKEGDVEDLAGALKKLLSETELRNRLVRLGVEKVHASFAWPAVARKLDALYRELVT